MDDLTQYKCCPQAATKNKESYLSSSKFNREAAYKQRQLNGGVMISRPFMNLATIFVATILSFTANSAEFIVKYKDAQNLISVQNIRGLHVLDEHATGNLLKVDIDEQNESEILASVRSNDNVDYVVPNFKLYAFKAPIQIQTLKEQWANDKVNAAMAWQLAGNKGSRDVIVAVIDTGVDYNHESLRSNMIAGYDFKDNDNDPMDETGMQNPGHGTHCTGSVAGTGEANGGIEGLSPVSSIMPIRFLGADGGGDLMAGIKSIDFAIENGAHIISASWGAAVGRSQAKPLIEAVQRADDAGVIFIAAAANDGKNNDTRDVFPANAGTPNMISVAASGPSDEKPNWSNYGLATVDIAAPGLNIMSTLPNNKYGNLSGTSMATPLVSGVVALLKAQDNSLTGKQVRSLMQSTAKQLNFNVACNCRVDAGAAMKALLDKKMVVVPATTTLEVNGTQKFEALHGTAPFTFSVADENVATMSEDGVLTAKADGETTVTVKDANGQTAESLKIRVGKKSGGDNGGGGGGGGGACPIGDQSTCDAICQIIPNLPWCK